MRQHRISVRDATVEKNFYLIEQQDGTATDALEDFLAKVESDAAQSVRRIVDDRVWPIPDLDRQYLAAWIAGQALRTPTQRQQMDELADRLLKLDIGVGGKPQIRQHLRDTLGREATDDEVDEQWALMSDFDSYNITADPSVHLQSMLSMWPGAITNFYWRGWTLVPFKRKALITSDTPVFLAPSAASPDASVGWANAAQVVVPLDRRMALVMFEVGSHDTIEEGSTVWAKKINGTIAHNSRRALFHHPDDTPLTGIELPEPNRVLVGGMDAIKRMTFEDGFPIPTAPTDEPGDDHP